MPEELSKAATNAINLLSDAIESIVEIEDYLEEGEKIDNELNALVPTSMLSMQGIGSRMPAEKRQRFRSLKERLCVLVGNVKSLDEQFHEEADLKGKFCAIGPLGYNSFALWYMQSVISEGKAENIIQAKKMYTERRDFIMRTPPDEAQFAEAKQIIEQAEKEASTRRQRIDEIDNRYKVYKSKERFFV